MCGISGYLRFGDARPAPGMLAQVSSALRHRGPDDAGLYEDGPVGLAQARLSIIDLAGGHQPLSNEDGSIWITFNGEIYEHERLRSMLQKKGHTFRTHSDTEAIVHLYEEFGVNCVDHLRGMFAFALWDGRRRRLLLARDHVGKKPLFYAVVDGTLWFASELHALAPLLPCPEIDPTAIDDYLTFGYIGAPKTIYQNVQKLPAAHRLVVEAGSLRSERYWQLTYAADESLSDRVAEDELLNTLDDAVRVRMRADVPVGALLSGGVDSSLIVALMTRHTDRPIKTFSVGFADAAYNELPYAAEVARKFGTEHHELVVEADAFSALPLLVHNYSEPFADSSAVATYWVAKLTREHVKVALNGDGGDESFAGYDRYRALLAMASYGRLPAAVRSLAARGETILPQNLPRRHRLRQLSRLIRGAEQPLPLQYLSWVSYFSRAARVSLYTDDFQAQLDGYDADRYLLDVFTPTPKGDLLNAALAADVETYLPYDLLVKMDIATMANSLEARSPLLDRRVMEFAARLPQNQKIRGGRGKYLLKRLARRFFPGDHINRRKMGFGLPVAQWLRSDLRPMVHDVLLSDRARLNDFIHTGEVRRLVTEHERGRDHSSQIWALLWLELWQQQAANSLQQSLTSAN